MARRVRPAGNPSSPQGGVTPPGGVSVHQLVREGVVYQDAPRSLAGLGAWVPGLAPQVEPLIRQIWAAIPARTASGSHSKP